MDTKITAVLAIAVVAVLVVGVFVGTGMLGNSGSSTTSDDGENLVDYSEYDETSDATASGFTVTVVTGSESDYAYTYNTQTKEYTLTFSGISTDSEYQVSSSSAISGNIVVKTDSDCEVKLVLKGLSISSSYQPPIAATTDMKLTVSASDGTTNTIEDNRATVTDGTIISSAVYCLSDMDVQGNGTLTVTSANNNGIHAKDDLDVKNVTLTVTCVNNALKGNDSVEVKSGTITLYATSGDGIKTSNSNTDQGVIDINTSEGDLTLTVKAYYVGIDGAVGVVIGDETSTGNSLVLKVYTYTAASTSTSSYMTLGAPSWGGQTAPGGSGAGEGGADSGNSNKSDDSTKAIKTDSYITIYNGTITLNAPADDTLHVNSDVKLETGSYGTGTITIEDGSISLSSGDDAAHADGALTVNGGTILVTKAYEGLEGDTVTVNDGLLSITSTDDGINASTQIVLAGGDIYVYSTAGDGIDSNGTTSKKAILFSGANVAVVSASSGNSSIDTDVGFTWTAGHVVAVSVQGNMASESANTSSAHSYWSNATASGYVTISVSGTDVISVQMPTTISSAYIVYLGSSSASYDNSAPSGLTNTIGNLYA